MSDDVAVKPTQKDVANLLRMLPPLVTDKRRTIKFDHQNPMLLNPRGTCYLVELLEVEESRDVATPDGGKVKLIVPQVAMATKNDKGEIEPGIAREFTRGWIPAIILRAGNGWILNESMHSTFVPGVNDDEFMENIKTGKVAPPDGVEVISEQGSLVRTVARHPMVYAPGQVVLVDRLARREVELQGKRYAFVEQIDILATFEGVTLKDLEVDE